ncbi:MULTISPECIES: serine hydrolase [unclassified Brevundimonas]|uniref:serine hydrolase n=1 Tax=unclassified Brevundimonas TaxID=2622653 RepID=UPI0025C5A70C|nr:MULTISPECIES: serine hydrolase [unclassified Brevundimonas]
MIPSLSRRAALLSGGAVALTSSPAFARAAANDDTSLAQKFDAYVQKCLAAWPDQPAVSVSLVKDGQTLLAKGYGTRIKGQNAPVDEHTLFAIASNSKNVTAACLGMLVDEGKVKWDEPVKAYLPEFTLSDPVIAERITVRDTLSHRAGFGLGAGDLLFWPNSDRSRADVLRQAAFVPIEDGFRANYHYCNLMFVVAGAIIERMSGLTWEEFVQTRVFNPLGMTDSVPLARLADASKSALPHGRIGPPLRYQGEMQQIAQSIAEVWNWDNAAAAGGICASAHDWAKWIALRLNNGEMADGSRLFSEAVAKEMYKPNIIVSSSEGPTAALPNRAIASTYALGLQVQDYRGERIATHGGGSPGGISATVLIPGRKTGFSVFTNAEESFLLRALRSGLSDIAMGKEDVDWIADSKRLEAEGIQKSLAAAAEIDAKQRTGAPTPLPLSAYTGTWRDPWYGDIVIAERSEGRGRNRRSGLWVTFTHTPALKGWIEPYDGNTLRTRFIDKREEDAFFTFEIENGQPVRATLKGVSPDIDFSYDYQNLRLTKVG